MHRGQILGNRRGQANDRVAPEDMDMGKQQGQQSSIAVTRYPSGGQLSATDQSSTDDQVGRRVHQKIRK